MRRFGEGEIRALTLRWLVRAKRFMRAAEGTGDSRDIARLAGMASTLEYAARDLCAEAGVDADALPFGVSRDVEPERRTANALLTDDSKEG